jgi:hypothetical protein
MKRTLTLCAALGAAVLMSTACGFEHSTSVLAPTGVGGGPTSTPANPTASPAPLPAPPAAPPIVGPWTSNALPSVPDPNTCGEFQFQVSNQTPTSIAGSFSARCGSGLTISGSGTGQLSGSDVTLNISGSASGAGLPNCPFTLTATGTI